jgi:predicted porin
MLNKFAPTAIAIAIACVVAGIALPAAAQSNITVYGIIDGAVEHYTNANAAGDSVTRLPSLGGGMFPSRLGFRGTEDLGGGLKAIFALENGFAEDTGALGQGNRLFGRQAWVGLAGSWGQVTIGRNYNMMTISTYDFDLIGPSQYGVGSLDPFIPNGRTDNSIAYKGTFGGVTAGAHYSLGRDTSSAGGPAGTNCGGESAVDAHQCREYSAMLRYDTPQWGIVGAYDRLQGGPLASGGLNTSDKTDSRMHGAVLVKLAAWKIGAGAIIRNNEGNAATPRSNLYYVAAAFKATPLVTIDGQLSTLDYKGSTNDSKQALVRLLYDFSKRTTVYVAAGRMNNRGTAALTLTAGGSVGAGLNQTGVITGIKHSF